MNRILNRISQLISGTSNRFDDSVPLDGESLEFISDRAEMVASFGNDAREIRIGYPDKWLAFIQRPAFHRLIVWYLARHATE